MSRQFGFFRRTAGGSGAGVGRGLLRFWLLWEWLAHRLQPTRPVPGSTGRAFTIRITQYRGRPFDLPDGTHIARSDWVAEVHLDNARVAELTRDSFWGLYPAFTSDLAALAHAVERGDLPPIKAAMALTLLVTAGRYVGFWRRERPITWRSRFERFYFNGLLAVYTPSGVGRLGRGRTAEAYPQEIWISANELLRRYGDGGSGDGMPALGEEPEKLGPLS